MKNTVILHGTNGSPTENWFDWLRAELEKIGHKVWVPQLPECDKPNIKRYNKFLLEESNWEFNDESILVGHSSGAVAILGLLQKLPEGKMVNTCYLVGSFKNNLDWDALDGLFEEPLDYDLIRTKAKKFIFIHSDNDPYCPLEHAQFQSQKLDGELIVMPGQFHFSLKTAGEKYKRFPELLELIVNK